jgi:hypothetical protein
MPSSSVNLPGFQQGTASVEPGAPPSGQDNPVANFINAMRFLGNVNNPGTQTPGGGVTREQVQDAWKRRQSGGGVLNQGLEMPE